MSNELVPRWQLKKSVNLQQSVLEYAKKRFFECAVWEEVFRECGIPQKQWLSASRDWKKEKEATDDRILSDIRLKAIGEHCEDLARDSLQLIARTLKALNEQEALLTDMKQLEAVARIATGMWKISQVEQGKATSISAIEVMSPSELNSFVQERAKSFSNKHGSIIDLSLEGEDEEDR